MNNLSKHWFSLLIIVGLIVVTLACNQDKTAKNNSLKLWYSQPAKTWNDALPLGNGKIGVMVFGNTSNERIQLNDDSMWPGSDKEWGNPEGNKEDLNALRQLLFDGKIVEADAMFVDKFSNKTVRRSHQTLGDLFIDFDHQNITDYKRTLDIDNAISTVSYKSNGNLITEKIFVSAPDKAIMIEFTSEADDGLNGKIRLTRPEDNGHPTVISSVKDNILIMDGEVTQRAGKFRTNNPASATGDGDGDYALLNGVKFQTCLKVKNEGGEVTVGKDYQELKNVKKATFYLVTNSSYYFEDYQGQNKKDLAAIKNLSFEAMQSRHIEDYQSLFSRVALDLNGHDLDSIPTDERLQRVKDGQVDLDLETLLYQYGRYLLISSSRPGTNPANLQGLWNNKILAPWNADYHLNINLQMNYWLADMTNLSELNQPLFEYVDRLIENGKVTARKNFGCGGAYLPHATDLWAPTWMRAPKTKWGCSLAAGGWMAQHYWHHYEYTRDENFLKNQGFPALEAIAQFYSDWIIKDPRDGKLISAPSTSPENEYITENGDIVASCLGSAMDQQVIDEVFTNYIKASEVLGIENEMLEKVKSQQEQLRPGFVLGEGGRILEWDRQYKENEPGHRHMSHLYGFHPGTSITASETPEIFEAVRKTLDYRLANGGAGTGWSRAWLINCAARLFDGAMAHEHIQFMFKKSIMDNLFALTGPFQIDGNFGFTAGLTEMLLQSHEANTMRLLPALPPLWKDGTIKGLKARGGFIVGMEWAEGKLTHASIFSPLGGKCKINYKGQIKELALNKGEKHQLKF
jgi:alpha-L-fucosidase 2